MGGRGGSSGSDWRDGGGSWNTPAERKAKALAEKARVDKIYKDAMARESKMSDAEKQAQRLKNLKVASDSLTRKQSGQKQSSVNIGGKTFQTSQEIDNYYDKEYKKSRDILETSNAMNRILGTSGGFTIGGKVFTSSEQLRKHYKAQADKAKKMLNNSK